MVQLRRQGEVVSKIVEKGLVRRTSREFVARVGPERTGRDVAKPVGGSRCEQHVGGAHAAVALPGCKGAQHSIGDWAPRSGAHAGIPGDGRCVVARRAGHHVWGVGAKGIQQEV